MFLATVTKNQPDFCFIGNRCGHISNAPVFFKRDDQKKTPPDALVFAFNGLKEYYYKPNKWLKNIMYSRRTNRKQRSEAREAVSRVTQVILDHTNLATLQAVKFNPYTESFRPLKVSEMAKLAGISYKRCVRALKVLKESLYIKLHYRTKITDDGKIRGEAAIKHVSRDLFYDLGVSATKLSRCISHAKKHLYGKKRKAERENQKRLTFLRKKSLNTNNMGDMFKSTPKIKKPTEKRMRQGKVWAEKACSLMHSQPDLTREEIIQRIGSPPNH
jgi:hypothetical protein